MDNIKVHSPLSAPEEVKPLAEAGTDEFYCGIMSKEWEQLYTRVGSQNKRYWEQNNFRSFEDLETAIKIAHSYKKPVFLTVNAQFYTQKQYPLLLKEINKMVEISADALIISDLALLLTLKKKGLNVDFHLSSISTVLNSKAAEFYKKIGISRIILPRQVTIAEIEEISSSGIPLEAFILNEKCWNMDGLCTFNHGILCKDGEKRDGCSLNYDITILNNNTSRLNIIKQNRRIRQNIFLPQTIQKRNECGICALYYFKKYGVNSVKIIGRGHALDFKKLYISFIKKALSIPDCSFENFQRQSRKLYKSYFNNVCNEFSCYYPELL